MVVKARIKLISQIPPNELCCEGVIEWFKKRNEIKEIFEVDPTIQDHIQLECIYCGVLSSVLVIRVINSSEGSGWGQLNLYDLMEGS